MKIFYDLKTCEQTNRKIVLACGFFDGIHRGHQQVISKAKEISNDLNALTWVMTFDSHPLKTVNPKAAPRLLNSAEHKLKILKTTHIDGCIILPFNKHFANLKPDTFIKELITHIPKLTVLVAGTNWTFGKQGTGTLDLLKQLSQNYGFSVEPIAPVMQDGKLISSTQIRKYIQTGNLAKAEKMLGRKVSVFGKVIHGRKIGRNIDIRTANLECNNEIYPPDGIYAAKVDIKGKKYIGVVNLGFAPTVRTQDKQRQIELHILNFDSDLYNQNIEIYFFKKLREEKKFSSLKTLQKQILLDISKTKKLFLNN
jgi:riboflavin kinase / FMN adenylyltransferase